MKISLIVDLSQLEDPDAPIPQVARLLSEWGAIVRLLIPETCYLNLAHIQPTADLYLLASCTPLALDLAGMLEALGATLLIPYPTVHLLHNKLLGLRMLQAHGLPVPETYVATNLAQLKELLAAGPLTIKSAGGTQPAAAAPSERHVYHVRELPTAVTPQSPIVVQRYLEPCAQPWRINCIGGQLLGLEPRQPVHRGFRTHLAPSPTQERWHSRFPGRNGDLAPADVGLPGSAEVAELALRCGQAFDIDLFGIKVVDHQGVLYVVDMVSFPECTEAPEAAPRLAEYLYAKAQFVLEKKCETVAMKPPNKQRRGSFALPRRLSHQQSLYRFNFTDDKVTG